MNELLVRYGYFPGFLIVQSKGYSFRFSAFSQSGKVDKKISILKERKFKIYVYAENYS